MSKEKILIVDDSEMNRSILADILEDNYEIIEAEDGQQGVELLEEGADSIDLVLLDIVMPRMDGFGVLEVMNEKHWIEDIPVIMVSAEREANQISKAYDLGVTDFIIRPFDTFIVRNRVVNTLLLYAKQKQLIGMVEEQLNEKEKYSNTMIDILSHIVETRNGESGLHVLHVRVITDFLLRKLRQKSDLYDLTEDEIALISNASALHDIGKMSIDEGVLNKPGRLTDEEFEVMKSHTVIGAQMLEGESLHQDEPLLKIAHEICRWHHERYDGRGYPDGMKGDDIPISAQVVALADVYDALTSARVYKAAYDHDTAVQMILNGECGNFNPLLLECLRESSQDLRLKLESDLNTGISRREIKSYNDAMRYSKADGLSARSLRLLDDERLKNNAFSALAEEIQFEYDMETHRMTFSSWGAKKLGVDEVISDADEDPRIRKIFGGINWGEIMDLLEHANKDNPRLNFECEMDCAGELRWHHVIIRSVWNDLTGQCERAIGKAVDIHDSRVEMDALKKKAARDPLTGLLNFGNSKLEIEARMKEAPEENYVLALFDLDDFRKVNETYGRQFGNQVLQHVAEVLNDALRGEDISSRIGGDEFLFFLRCEKGQEQDVARRLFRELTAPYNGDEIQVSMGVARSADMGPDYETMFKAAEDALDQAKEHGRSQICFYEPSGEDA